MALQLNYTNSHNENYPEAYARIHEFYGRGTVVKVEIFFYKNQLSYQNGEFEIERFGYDFDMSTLSFKKIYELLKKEDLFKDAVNV